jgi:outer membrane lipoprotein SlyB
MVQQIGQKYQQDVVQIETDDTLSRLIDEENQRKAQEAAQSKATGFAIGGIAATAIGMGVGALLGGGIPGAMLGGTIAGMLSKTVEVSVGDDPATGVQQLSNAPQQTMSAVVSYQQAKKDEEAEKAANEAKKVADAEMVPDPFAMVDNVNVNPTTDPSSVVG